MSVAKVIELIAEGDSIESAIKSAVKEASKSVRHIRGVNVENIQAIIDDEVIVKYRVNCKVTFVVES